MPDSNSRLNLLRQWSASQHALEHTAVSLELAAGDASFRRYYRLTLPDTSTRMLMDAPPEHEDSTPFVAIAKQWQHAGLPVPTLHAVDLDAGFIELDDLGDCPMQLCLNGNDGDATHDCFERAIDVIHEIQNRANPGPLPAYDAALLNSELALFPEWCLTRWLDLPPPDSWPDMRDSLVQASLALPTVTVHRDYDAMNLMAHDGRLHIIDFQDAVAGPLSYDLISLLHGRYCRFSRERRRQWQSAFHARAQSDGRLSGKVTLDEFNFRVAAMAAQRSLKVLGIFCRLTLRDQRDGYLERLPHFLNHLSDALNDLMDSPDRADRPGFGMLEDFQAWVEATLRPALEQRLASELEAQP